MKNKIVKNKSFSLLTLPTLTSLGLLAFSQGLQAATPTNGAAKRDLEKLFFNKTDNKGYSETLNGKNSSGGACTLTLRSTRFGTYVDITYTSVSPKRLFEAGVTNSHLTTENLTYSRNDVVGTLDTQRNSVSGFGERDETEYGREELLLKYALKADKTIDLQSASSSFQEIVDPDPNGQTKDLSKYVPKGEPEKADCTVGN